ncbi:MAG: tRNA (N6-threonylcarbamoyladenosine(37)-N6)-methyltransferase TrmO [Phycisphaerae bacterium]|jgi:tRNA-Thr(GGU) m(6)t(6)A37 methyltransferase TsaA|nr:tRNA (N6-threonylcarbamoyladenosine(37)-N6)-methyltransferase TrmO [Phycisphaerae bacterium]
MDLCVIGRVVSDRTAHQWGQWRRSRCEIHVNGDYADGLSGLEDFSHVLVVYAMDNMGKVRMKVTPQGKDSSPEVGVFASRCPWRPTPIGVTAVKLLGVDGAVLSVEGLDAIDGTEVLDIKPYMPQYDAVEDCRYPAWVDQLEF